MDCNDIPQKSEHGGNVHRLLRTQFSDKILDFSANINPLGPPEWLRRQINRDLHALVHYPDPDCYDVVRTVASVCGVDEDCVVVANGTTELFHLIPQAISFSRVVIPVPCYVDYIRVMQLYKKEIVRFPLDEKDNFTLDLQLLSRWIQAGDLVLLGRPNNPTATCPDEEELAALASNHPDTLFLIDEAFLEFVPEQNSLAGRFSNVMTLHSLTKFYGIPGLRLGYGVFPASLAARIRSFLPPWSVNSLAQSVGCRLLTDTDYQQRTVKYVRACRTSFLLELCRFSTLRIFPSKVNYVLIQILNGIPASAVQTHLLEKGIAIRLCDNYDGLDSSYFRIAVRTQRENSLFIEALSGIFDKDTIGTSEKNIKATGCKTPALMIQGTSSNAGKSILVAALCRIFMQDGVHVAPFKAQNMSLNSYVTRDGFEMGRAQVVQAQAARLEPDVRMNPILLKPSSDVGSQIIVNGKSVGNMSVSQYVAYKTEAGRYARKSYDSLASEYDLIVLEGAGSPGEVNLKKHDIVNMGMARYAEAPVLIVGDIDRGGVYASFIGTMDVLEEWERQLVAGFLVNKFRGDKSLLDDAHQYVLEHTGVPVLGTVPHIAHLGLPEEDSVSFKSVALKKSRPREPFIEIACISLPHISNFTDIEPFYDEPDVYIHTVETLSELEHPDVILLPGSKNVFGDLQFLQSSNLAAAIVNFAGKGCEIVGICGGYQLLGRTVSDPSSIESVCGVQNALGLLDLDTVLAPQKTLIRRKGLHLPSGLPVDGYEIHHGLSSSSLEAILQFEDGSRCGAKHSSLNVWGSYLHGIFDADGYRRYFIDTIRRKKGYEVTGEIRSCYNLERAFDRLADIVRSSVAMDQIYALLRH